MELFLLQYDEYKIKLQAMKPQILDLRDALGLDRILTEIEELELKAAQPGFWDDMENSQKILQKTSQLKACVENFNKLYTLYEDVETMLEMAAEEEDESLLPEIEESYQAAEAELEAQRLSTLLTGEYDKNNAILTFHSGAGGTEAQDWVEMPNTAKLCIPLQIYKADRSR